MRLTNPVLAFGILVGVGISRPAHAQAQPAPQPAQPAPQGVQSPQVIVIDPSQANGPQYQTPLAQQTQPTYVPQSVALSGPRELKDWNEGDPVPPGYHTVERTRKGLLVGGAITFGVFYLFSTLAAASGEDKAKASGRSNAEAPLFIPVVGPFIRMGTVDSGGGKWICAVDGIAQAGGMAMLIAGLISTKTVVVRNDLGMEKVTVTPIVARDSTGVGLVGSF